MALERVPADMKNDETICMAAGEALKFASDELKANCDIVLAAVTHNWLALGYASEEMKNNEAIVTAAFAWGSLRSADSAMLGVGAVVLRLWLMHT